MTAILLAKELYGQVNWVEAIASFEKAQKWTKALLVTSIRSDLIYIITECQTPKEIWDTLKKHSERVTIANNF